MTCERLNALDPAEARAQLARCCGTGRWVERMLSARPFASRATLLAEAERAFRELSEPDWREAFSHHPAIGDVAALREKFAATAAWAASEQAGAAAAAEQTLAALAEGNRTYRERFGYIFIVCATGRSADEMLAMLQGRVSNEPAAELRIAIEEQMKITRLRLEKLLDGAP